MVKIKDPDFVCTGNLFSDFLAFYDLWRKYYEFDTKFDKDVSPIINITIRGCGKNIKEAIELSLLLEKVAFEVVTLGYKHFCVRFEIININLTSEKKDDGKMQSVIIIKLRYVPTFI